MPLGERTTNRGAATFAIPLVAAAGLSLLLAAPASAGVTFDRTSHPAGVTPSAVAAGDLNGDAAPDLAVANAGSGDVSTLLGNGTGGFAAAVSRTTGQGPRSVAIGDVNGDADPDMVTASGLTEVSVLLSDGAGGFMPSVDYAAGNGPASVAIADLNGDGIPDLAIGNRGTTHVSVMTGNGTGAFGAPAEHAAGDDPISLATGDFNGDGRPDLAVADNASGKVSVLLATGGGAFAAPVEHTVGTAPASVAVGDLNGDGKLDLAAANSGSENASVLLGNGAGGFAAAVNHPTTLVNGHPASLAITDLNGDGRSDLAVVSGTAGVLSVLLGTGSGGFATAVNYLAGPTPNWVAAADLNADGKADLAITNAAGVSTLLNTSRPAIGLSTSSLAFGNQAVGTPSGSQAVSITNTDSAPLSITDVRSVGANADEFVKAGDGCTGLDVPAGGTCQVGVRFAPVAPGSATATLRVVSNASSTPATISVGGTGTPAPAPPAGAQGTAGANGANGTDGSTGPRGDPGSNGINGAVGPAGLQGPAGSNGRDAVVTCKPGKAKKGKVKVTCTVAFRAGSSSTRVRARLTRGRHVYASGARAVRPGAGGSVSLRAHRRLPHGIYTLLLTFTDARGGAAVVQQRVNVR